MVQDHYIEWNIIARKLKGELSAEEEKEFRKWLEKSEVHRHYYEKARLMWEEPANARPVDVDKLIARFDEFADHTMSVRPSRRLMLYVRYAAVAVLLLGIAGGLLLWDDRAKQTKHPLEVAGEQQTAILPGTARAHIILADGQQMDLGGVGRQEILHQEQGAAIRMSQGNVAYEAAQTTQEEVYNTIVIPRGGEYCLKLSDGTRVWLNARSRLHFPVNFVGKRRVVELEGEAYFEVARDAGRLFIVKTSTSEVRVYGTAFNVRAYANEKVQHTTLAEGKVGIFRQGKEYRLQPGQQAKIGDEGVTIEEVNPNLYCSWHKGLLLFENQRLEDIMMRLADWYDVEIMFADQALKDLHFTGDLERYADFTDILTLIGMTTNVGFEVTGRVVTVSGGKK